MSKPKKRSRGRGRKPDAGATFDFPIRLNRFIARSGVCSRRQADDFIEAGRVKVNGEVVSTLGAKIEESDRVSVGGKMIHPKDLVYILLNKPKNTITTVSDDRGRRTVLDVIADEKLKVGLFPVGRLDRDTTGAILLTSDGDIANRLMHPKWDVKKIYVATTRHDVSPEEILALTKGVELDDGPAAADNASFVTDSNPRKIALQLHEGRNRLVRRMVEKIGNEVVHLDRIRYAGLTLDGLKRGRWRKLQDHEVRRLRKLVRL